MKPITKADLVACGASSLHAGDYVEPLNKYLTQYKVTTFVRLAHFLSQILHESIRLTATAEDLNYSAEQLMELWEKRFPTLEMAKAYAHQPVKIANYVYANRLGNGPVESGDGWRYRGRGPMENTGKDKYIRFTKLWNIDYVNYPEYLERPDDGMRSAFQFWADNNLNVIADTDNPVKVTEKVNGGHNGLQSRIALLARCKTALAPLFAIDQPKTA